MFQRTGSFRPKLCSREAFLFFKIASGGEKDGQQKTSRSLPAFPRKTKYGNKHSPTRDTRTDIRPGGSTAEAPSAQERPLLGQHRITSSTLASRDIPGCNFHPSHFPPGSLRQTGPRNKTSTRNFSLTSTIFTGLMEEKGRNLKVRAPYPFLFPLLFIKQDNTSKTGREEEIGGWGVFEPGSIST